MKSLEEQADSLILKFKTAIVEELEGGEKLFDYTAKQCALLHCDLMIEELKVVEVNVYEGEEFVSERINYYQQLKEAIKKR